MKPLFELTNDVCFREQFAMFRRPLVSHTSAGLHASTWHDRGMENYDWAKIDEATANGFAQGVTQLKPAFRERFRAELSDADVEILDRLVLKAASYWRYSFECKNQAHKTELLTHYHETWWRKG